MRIGCGVWLAGLDTVNSDTVSSTSRAGQVRFTGQEMPDFRDVDPRQLRHHTMIADTQAEGLSLQSEIVHLSPEVRLGQFSPTLVF